MIFQTNLKIEGALMAKTYKIDFENIKGNKLYFYEKRDNGKLIEYAYLDKNDPDYIYFKPEEDIDVHEFPKEDFNEFMIMLYKKISVEKFGKEIDKKSKTSTPMYKLKIIGKKVEVIAYLAIQMGFLNALKFCGIKYYISNKKESKYSYNVITKDGSKKYINIFPETPYQEYIINGMREWKKKIQFIDGEINKPEIWKEAFDARFGKGIFNKLREFENKIIDGTTEKILRSYSYPTTPVELFGKVMPKMILNKKVDDQNDLSTKRIRMSEAIAHLAYKQMQMAIVDFKKNKKGRKPRLYIDEWYIVKNLIGSGMLQWTTPINLGHGNWPGAIPTVYRWPYDYSKIEGRDFIPQTEPLSEEEIEGIKNGIYHKS